MSDIEHKTTIEETLAQRALWAAAIMAGNGLVFLGLILYLTFQTPTWQLYILSVVTFIASCVGFVSIWQIRQERVNFGVWLLFGYAIPPIVATLMVSAAGLPAAAFIALFSSLSIAFVVPSASRRGPIVYSAIAVAIALAIELLNPAFRHIVPELVTFAPIATGIMAVVFLIVMLRQALFGNIRAKLITSFLFVSIVSLAILTIVVNQSSQTALTQQVGNTFAEFANDELESVRNFFQEKIGQLRALSISDVTREAVEENNAAYTGSEAQILSQIKDLDEAWITAPDNDPFILGVISDDPDVNLAAHDMADFVETFADQTELILTDRHGATVAASGRLSDYYQADEGWWQAAWNDGQGALYISEPEYDESAGVTALLVAMPIIGEETGKPIGVLRSTIVVDSLYDLISRVQIGDSGHAVLLDYAGVVLFDPRADTVNTAGLPEETIEHFLEHGHYDETGVVEAVHYDEVLDQNGNQIIVGHATFHTEEGEAHEHAAYLSEQAEEITDTVEKLEWTILVRQDSEEALSVVSETRQIILIVAVAILFGASLAGLGLSQLISRPIVALSQAADEMGAGNLDAPLPEPTSDEIGTLTTNLGTMAAQLQETLGSLEQQVEDRTRALETSTEVSRRLSTILEQQQLVREVVEQLQSAFGYYHAHIYLYDAAKQNLEMAGGTGDAGRTMLARGHKIEKGRGLVGRAADTNEVVLIPDVSKAVGWLPNPLLPDTKAEVAVPIAIGPEVLGVLDVQHNVIGGLSEQDADLIQAIANQVGIAVQNAQAYERAQRQAVRETQIVAINQRIQSATTIDDVLKIAVSELGQALEADLSSVELNASVPFSDGHK